MTPIDLRNINTTGNSCRDAHPWMNMALKLSRYFYLLMQKPLGRYFQIRSFYYQAAHTVQPENTYSCILKVTGQVWESQKRISINTNHGYNQHSSPQASLNRSNNKARFSFNQPNRKRWYAKLVDVKHLLHKAFFILTQVLEGLPSKIK